MTFPSLQSLSAIVKQVLKRFPFEIFFACIGTLAGIVNVEVDSINSLAENWCLRILMVANLGLLVSLATTLFLESRGIKQSRSIILKLIVALLAVSLVFLLNPMEHQADFMRFLLMSLAFHLLVAFSPYINRDATQGFWQFNKTLFLRFATSILYSSVLYLGLMTAIGAMNFLFNFDFKYDTFLILWICIAGLFNTLFFLAGVPQDLPALDQDFSYPKGLKIFTQYVLIPLATVYVIILLTYETKILVQWNLPKGMVSNLILGYAVFGILSLLLVFPVREQEENKWIKIYARSFYFLMLPLIVLLFLAVGNRVFHYGITEYRYFLILLAFWLLFITIYFLLSKKQNIKLIPVSLCILTLLSIYGPQSASSVSRYSQKRILINIFKRNNAFEKGKFLRVKKMSKDEAYRAMDEVGFLVCRYDLEVLQPYIDQDLNRVKDSINNLKENLNNRYGRPYAKTKWVNDYLGLVDSSNRNGYITDIDLVSYAIRSQQSDVIAVKGYDFILQQNTSENRTENFSIDQIPVRRTFSNNGLNVLVLGKDSATFDLKALMLNLLKDTTKLQAFKDSKEINGDNYDYRLPVKMLSMNRNTENFTVSYQINFIRFEMSAPKTYRVTYLDGIFLVKKNNKQ